MDTISWTADDLGGIQLGYQPEELAKMFFEFVQSHPSIHQDLRQFQLKERHLFMASEERTSLGEHRLEWSEAHRRFVEMMDKLMASFHEQVACSEQEFVGAMEECKTLGSPWWVPFCKILDVSDYQSFASMLQDNVCLCCGDPFMPYESEELLRLFISYIRQRPDVHPRLRKFQLEERHRFFGTEEKAALGEHRLEWSEIHGRFVEIIEGYFKDFIRESNCNEQEFLNAMAQCMRGCSSEWPPFAKLLEITDYTVFAKMLQSNACLCCGEPFSGYRPEEIAEKLTEYMQARPIIHEQLRDFQSRERHRFIDTEERVIFGEHRLEWTDAHRRFIELIDVHIRAFLQEIHCSEEEFMNALSESRREGGSSSLAHLSMLLNTADYEGFANMIQSNICFCCGQLFVE